MESTPSFSEVEAVTSPTSVAENVFRQRPPLADHGWVNPWLLAFPPNTCNSQTVPTRSHSLVLSSSSLTWGIDECAGTPYYKNTTTGVRDTDFPIIPPSDHMRRTSSPCVILVRRYPLFSRLL